MNSQRENNNFLSFRRHVKFWWPEEFTEAQKREAYERLCNRAVAKQARVSREWRAEESITEDTLRVEHVHRYSDMGPQEFDLLTQTALKGNHLEGRLNKLLERRKPRVIDKNKSINL